MFKKLENKKGITLIEIIISIAILGIIVTPLSGLFNMTISNNVRAKRLLIANQIAQETLEFTRNAINMELASFDADFNINPSNQFDTNYTNYNMNVDVDVTKVGIDSSISTIEEGSNALPTNFAINLDLAAPHAGADIYNLIIEASGDYSIRKGIGEIEIASGTITTGIDITFKLDYGDLPSGGTTTMTIVNNTDDILKIYKYKDESEANVSIIPRIGNVQAYTNINSDNTNDFEAKGRVYLVKVSSIYNGDAIVQMDSYVTVKGTK